MNMHNCRAGVAYEDLLLRLLPLASQDPNLHIKHLKPSPVASEIVDHCIECGFCESNCPSRDITLTPRQRIASYKEMARLQQLPSPTAAEQQRCVRLVAHARNRI